MLDTPEKRKTLSKWVIGTVTCCALIYLGFRHISALAGAFAWLVGLVKPLLAGMMLALMLNVPMRFMERLLKTKTKLQRGIRPLSILLSLVLVLGIFIGVAVLVVPELLNAVKLIVQIASGGLDQLSQMELDEAFLETSVGGYLSQISIDWLGLKAQLEGWIKNQSSFFMNTAVNAAGNLVGGVVSLFVALVFAIYILANKETLKRQVCRLIRVWLPKRLGEGIIHVSSVCSKVFRLFVAGQATEAIILGTLCMIGMAILRLPYAPMVGALVGVTALIPVVGAFVGTIVGAIMILTVDPFKALIFVVFLLVLQQVEGNMIYPRVVGSKINLPAMWVLAAVTVGGNLGGPIGMLLGVPAASAVYSLLREATQKRESARIDMGNTSKQTI